MPKPKAKAQASSSKAASGAFATGFGSTFGATPFGTSSSTLSYVSEPPDLSSISNPNIVVAFKNLSKKDGTTKSKALEELQSHIKKLKEDVEDSILEVWVAVYPRTAIENARRVRQLAHIVHGHMCLAGGKRIAKFMPQVVGPWLAGLFDPDKGVSKAAQDAMHQVFPTPEKLHSVRKIYLESILDFCKDTIDNETPQTLSDERTSSPDELEAKYCRVISAVVGLTNNLVGELSNETQKQQSLYAGLIQDEKVWKFAYYGDSQVRKAVHKLLKTCLEKHPDTAYSALSSIGSAYMQDALKHEQTGTSLDFVECLVALLKFDSQIWAKNTTRGKRTQRLCRFVKRGSQGGPPEYWSNLVLFFEALPQDAAADGLGDASDILVALHAGVAKRTEPRGNLRAAWFAYVEIFLVITRSLNNSDAEKLVESEILPIIVQYIRPAAAGEAPWSLPEQIWGPVVQRIVDIALVRRALLKQWPAISEQLVKDVKLSLPESSTDFDESQHSVATQGKRWVMVQGLLWSRASEEPERAQLMKSRTSVATSSLELIKSRNAKPYGAAALIEAILYDPNMGPVNNPQIKEQVLSFVRNDLPGFFVSPSAPYLAGILFFLYSNAAFVPTLDAVLQSILSQKDNSSIERALHSLLSSPHIPQTFDAAASSSAIQSFVEERTQAALHGDGDWSFLRLLDNKRTRGLPSNTTDDLLTTLTQSLSRDNEAENALEGIQTLVKSIPGVLDKLASKPETSQLLPRLLYLSESADESIAYLASEMSTSLQLGTGRANGDASSHRLLLQTIQKGLSEASETSVSVDTLVRLAQDLARHDAGDKEIVRNLLPASDVWKTALTAFLNIPPLSSAAVTSHLRGSEYLVETADQGFLSQKRSDVQRDANGLSVPLRIAQFTAALLADDRILHILDHNRKAELLYLLVLTVQLASDNLGIAGSTELWSQYSPEIESDMVEFVSDSNKLIHGWLDHSADWWVAEKQDSNYVFVKEGLTRLLQNVEGSSAVSYHHAIAYCSLASELVERHGWKSQRMSELEEQLQDLQKRRQNFAVLAFLTAHGSQLSASPAVQRICNGLVANLTGLDIQAKAEEALRSLVTLNAILYGHDRAAESIAQQRIVFFVKHVIQWLSARPSGGVAAEIMRALTALLPRMKDIYGEHWQLMLNAITAIWSNTPKIEPTKPETHTALPALYASLKLFDSLRRLFGEQEPNEDLVDAWQDSMGAAASGLFNVLGAAQACPDEFNQPLRATNELVARQISHLPTKNPANLEDLFQLLFAPSHSVQQAAFQALHVKIPQMQEQVSLDAALDKTDAKLPAELVSLVLEAPNVNDLEGTIWERGVPIPLKGFLLSWLLVFDHFDGASYKVKNDYANSLKDESCLPPLLDFAFDFLGHSRGRLLDASRFDVSRYDVAGEPPERDVQHILAHLYFLSLKHVSGLTKAWWLELRSRSLVSNVEQWTEKYISPSIVSDALSSVSQWSKAQSDPSNPNVTSDSENLKIGISDRAREIKASYDVDDTTMSISIRLPGAWPLRQAEVIGVSRVAIDERKWQSWLRGCQGVITFSNNSIVDGLVAFRRNVVGALKGQTECSICYSLVSADKQLPSKRCSTCKNLFHSGCLFKWFKTSNNSSCPLCRNPFNYG